MKDLAEVILSQIMPLISAGKRAIAIWGINEGSLRVAKLLNDFGVTAICRVALVDRHLNDIKFEPIHGCTVISSGDITGIPLEILIVTEDDSKEVHLREFAALDERHPHVVIVGVGHFKYSNATFSEVLKSCLVKSYATGYPDSLVHLFQAVQYLAIKELQGAVVEFGMFKGGTTEFLVRTLRRLKVNVTAIYGFDSFSGFPPRRSVFDLYANPDCEFTNVEAVLHHAEGLGVRVVQGDISETISEIRREPLILSFFDTDNYSPTRAAVEACYEQTVAGGILAFDHYHSEERFIYTIGERMAAHDALKGKSVFHLHGTGIFLKV